MPNRMPTRPGNEFRARTGPSVWWYVAVIGVVVAVIVVGGVL